MPTKTRNKIEPTDPRVQPQACVKTPGGLRAFVLGPDPSNRDRVLIEYESKGMGKDSYPPSMLELVCPAPEAAPPAHASIPYKVGDLLENREGKLALIEAVDRECFTILVSTGKRLEGAVSQLQRWGYYTLWSEGDRVTPKHNPGSRFGTIKGFNLRNKRTPLLIQFDGEQATGKWGTDAVIPADEAQSSALTTQSELIEAEILPSRSEQLAEAEAQIQEGQELRKQGEMKIWIAVHQIRAEKLWDEAGHESFEDYCLDRWGWGKSNAHEVAGAGEVVLQLQQSGAPELPISIAAIRPLRKLEPEKRLQVLEQANLKAGKLTAEAVKEAIAQLTPPKPATRQSREIALPDAMARAAQSMTPPPPPETPEGYKFKKGDYVEGLDDDSQLCSGFVAAVGPGYLRLEDNTAIYNPKLATPPIDNPATWQSKDRLQAAGVKFQEVSIPPSEFLPQSDPDELSEADRALLKVIKDLAAIHSGQIYGALCRLGHQPEGDIAAMALELEESICEFLESRLLGE